MGTFYKRSIMIVFCVMAISIGASGEDKQVYDFQIARVHYDGGGDWYSNPTSLPNLLRALKEKIGLNVPEKDVEITIDDQDIGKYPMIYMTGHGNISFSSSQIEVLRKYFLNGGFLWADDNYGMDQSFRREIKKLFPESDMVELPFSHRIYDVFYKFPNGLPKIHEHDGKTPQGFGVFVNGRMVIFYTYETDIGDGLESPEVHNDSPEKREQALQMAINIVLYCLNN